MKWRCFFHCLLCVLLFCQEPSKTWICAMPQIPSWWSSSSAATWGRTEPRWPPQVWQLFKLIFNKWMYAPQQKQQRRMKTFTRKIAWYLHVFKNSFFYVLKKISELLWPVLLYIIIMFFSVFSLSAVFTGIFEYLSADTVLVQY